MDKKNFSFDVDGLMYVLQAVKEGKPVEFRPLEETDWCDFDPTKDEIDTENCKYRVKPCEYDDNIGVVDISPKDLQEGRIYFLKSRNFSSTEKGFICVKSNLYRENKIVNLHFSWVSDGISAVLKVNDPNVESSRSEQSNGFANIILPNFKIDYFDDVYIYQPCLAQVKMLEEKLREVGYKFENSKIQKI